MSHRKNVDEEPKANDPPPLSSQARRHAKKITDKFDRDLKSVAERIAENAVAETVLIPHVNEALLTLKRAGLSRRPRPHLFLRSGFLIGAGSFLVGLSPTISSLAKDVLEATGTSARTQPIQMWIWMISLPVVVACLGCFMVGCGLRREEDNPAHLT